MPLLTAHGLHKRWGTRVLLNAAALHLEPGEKIGVVGENGTGKTTLLRCLAGLDTFDEGEAAWRRQTRVALLEQHPRFRPDATLLDVARGLGRSAADAAARAEDYEAAATLGALGLPEPDVRVDNASGGMVRRAAIAEVLLSGADVLLLDEPTNHLDIETIAWLETHVAGLSAAVLVVSHDRYFLDVVADRIVEVEGAQLHSWPGRFADYLAGRAEADALAGRDAHKRKQQWKTELAWLRRSPAARTTKSQARIDRALSLGEEVAADGPRLRAATLGIEGTARLGKTVLEAHDLRAGYATDGEAHVVVTSLTLALKRGERIGLLGPNGAGKSTLLRTLTGEQAPLSGTLVHGEATRIVSIGQDRAGLDASETVRRAASPLGGDFIPLPDGGKRHVTSYLAAFGFAPEVLDQPVSTLSGGQRFRLLLARRMLEPVNLLALDEPTNDLDLHTLRLLEDALLSFAGCLLLVSHDRFLLDRVCDRVLVLNGRGGCELHAGGYSDWRERQDRAGQGRKAPSVAGGQETAGQADGAVASGAEAATDAEATTARDAHAADAPPPQAAPPKPTLAEDAWLDEVEAHIERAEQDVADAEAALATAAAQQADHGALMAASEVLAGATTARDGAYARWQSLEDKRKAWQAWRAAQRGGRR